MDFKEIQKLGELTNRVIEIEGQLKELEKLATHSVKIDTASLRIDLHHSSKPVVSEKSDHMSDFTDSFIKSFLPEGIKRTVIAVPNHIFQIPHVSIKLTANYQYVMFEALIAVLKQEQRDLNNSISKETGRI